jgi:PAS domain S-box-containing protein
LCHWRNLETGPPRWAFLAAILPDRASIFSAGKHSPTCGGGAGGPKLGLVLQHDLVGSVTGDLMDTRLETERTFLRTLVNSIPDLVWLKGCDGVFLACNGAFERLCGAKECDIIGKCELDFADAQQADFFRQNDQAALVSGNSCRQEVWLTFADGYCRLFEAIKTPMRDSLGKLIGVLGVARDITAMRQVQEVREQNFRTLAENLPDNIARWDLAGRYLYINPTHERTLGVSASAIIGKEIPEIGKTALEKVIATGEAATFAYQAILVDGVPQIHDISMVPECDDEGCIVSVLGLGRNMTETYRLQEELADKERELRALAESSPGMMGSFYLRPDGAMCMPYVSHKIQDLFGLKPQDVRHDASALLALTHPDDAQRVMDTITASAQNMSSWHEEYRIIHPTQGERWMESNTHPQSHPQGGIVWYGYVHDITERKLIEQRLLLKEHVLDQAHEAVYLLNRTTLRFTYVNAAASNVLGYSREELLDVTLNEICPEFTPEEGRETWEKVLANGSHTFETRHRRRDGSVFPVEIQGSMFEYEGQALSLSLVRDITERKQAEHAVLKLNADISATLSAIPDLLFELDRHGKQLRLHARNPALLSQWNSDFVGQSLNQLLTPDAVGIVMEALDQADETGHSYGKVIGVSVAGRSYWFELSVARKNSLADAEVSFIVLARNVTERFDAEQRIKEHVHFLEGMDRVNKTIQEADDIQIMMTEVLDVVLSIFACDRAFLLYPCDPDAPKWTIPMERHRPQYPGVFFIGGDLPYDQAVADKMRLILRTEGPVKFGAQAGHVIPPVMADQFQIHSLMSIAIFPKTGSPWEFGIQQCSGGRDWKASEQQLFQAVGRRLSDSLSALLAYQNLLDSEEKLRQSNKQLLELSMRREADREDERRRIAREIHDELGQNLTAMRMSVSQLRFQFSATNPELASHVEHMHELATSTLQTVRDVTKSLRPPVLDEGIYVALAWLVNEFQQGKQVVCKLKLPSDSLVVDGDHAMAIFRIVQESLTNVVRHANATRVDINVQNKAGLLEIGIRDNGQGFDVDKVKMEGFGLIGMSERARMTGGSFEVQAKPGLGTSLTVIIPAQKRKEIL